ncbi:MAG: trans-2-enoyl-CoA reductase family protein [Bacillota bacterium]|nr:trans-2-enoyl-CoA reductase family protein [Bacillota bacterium]
MILKPRFKDYICTVSHPEGCKKNVLDQIEYTLSKNNIKGSKHALIIGASTGYGLASRIASTFGMGADTIGVIFEKPASERRTASSGWYNTAAFEEAAVKSGFNPITINGDAFSNEVKETVIEAIKKNFGKIDLIVYSLASPRRKDPASDVIYHSVLKTIDEVYENKSVDFHNKTVFNVKIDTASNSEIEETIKVMGGEDWKLWIEKLKEADVLDHGVKTLAYSYIGPELTHAIYKNGTIGKAKANLELAANDLNNYLSDINGTAYVSINRALVTQSSMAIPVVPLYISLLNKIMKEKNINEGCIQQIVRLFSDILYKENVPVDTDGRIRLDDLEMKEDVQKQISELWDKISTENLKELTDIDNFEDEFFKLFGFNRSDVDYSLDVNQNVEIKNLL